MCFPSAGRAMGRRKDEGMSFDGQYHTLRCTSTAHYAYPLHSYHTTVPLRVHFSLASLSISSAATNTPSPSLPSPLGTHPNRISTSSNARTSLTRANPSDSKSLMEAVLVAPMRTRKGYVRGGMSCRVVPG